MRRFFKYALRTFLISVGLITLTYCVFVYKGFRVESVKLHSFSDFDFASYSFGLVAVALSFAGIYISIILEECSEQLYRLLNVHFVPFPFDDMRALEKACHPTTTTPGLAPTPGLRCAHAIVCLRKWSALSIDAKRNLLSLEGLSAGRGWFGPVFSYFQSGRDRLLVASVGVSTAFIYVALPIAYWFDLEVVAAAMLVSIYVMCVIEIALCSGLYFAKWFFISGVNSEMPKWAPEMANSLLMATMNRASSSAS